MKIYLATPYTHTQPTIQHRRFQKACRLAGEIMLQGHIVFSPIAHSHPIATRCSLPGKHDFWQEQNAAWLEWADELWVGMIEGWDQSVGIKWEVEKARLLGKRIAYCPGV